MREGRVRLNGEVIYTFALKMDPLLDQVCVDNQPIAWRQTSTTLMLYKPWGVLTTMLDPYDRPCVASFVPTDRYPGLYPLGRLDKDTTGLLLFSTNGQLGRYLLQPKYHVEKTYTALVTGTLSESELQALREGVVLDDGLTAPAYAEVIESSQKHIQHDFKEAFTVDPNFSAIFCQLETQRYSLVSLTLHEGRMHQVKRMLRAVGHEVLYLHRPMFANLTLEDLQPGQWRLLSGEEVTQLTNLRSNE